MELEWSVIDSRLFYIKMASSGSIAVARYPRHTAQALHFARSPGQGLWRNVKFP